MEDYAPLIRAIYKLKSVKRQGWLDFGLDEQECESVAAHAFGTTALAILLHRAGLLPADIDLAKLLILSTIHDIPEAITGDITPRNTPPRDERTTMEKEALGKIFHAEKMSDVKDLLLDFININDEYSGTREAHFLRQIDKLDMMLQATFYEKQFGLDLREFHARPDKYINDPRLREFFRAMQASLGGSPGHGTI